MLWSTWPRTRSPLVLGLFSFILQNFFLHASGNLKFPWWTDGAAFGIARIFKDEQSIAMLPSVLSLQVISTGVPGLDSAHWWQGETCLEVSWRSPQIIVCPPSPQLIAQKQSQWKSPSIRLGALFSPLLELLAEATSDQARSLGFIAIRPEITCISNNNKK